MQRKNKTIFSSLINKKSIILDQIEKRLTCERIKNLCGLTDAKINTLNENLIFKCRKCIIKNL